MCVCVCVRMFVMRQQELNELDYIFRIGLGIFVVVSVVIDLMWTVSHVTLLSAVQWKRTQKIRTARTETMWMLFE